MSRYVALGSSFASGPGLPHGTAYPRLVAARLGLELTDVSLSGATTAHVLRDSQLGRPPQVEALDGTEALVTITIAGNDLSMSAATMTAALPRLVRRLPVVRRRAAGLLDPTARLADLERVGDSLHEVVATVRRLSPDARVVLVDYLTVLPPSGQPSPPIETEHADLVRSLAAGLAAATARVAGDTGCTLVRARAASSDHHAWSAEPWVAGAGLALPLRPLPFHPNVTGMAAVADLVVEAVGEG